MGDSISSLLCLLPTSFLYEKNETTIARFGGPLNDMCGNLDGRKTPLRNGNSRPELHTLMGFEFTLLA